LDDKDDEIALLRKEIEREKHENERLKLELLE
jgi:uncharacterized small protein (DUF1192 family)